jgi:hypothetical protein
MLQQQSGQLAIDILGIVLEQGNSRIKRKDKQDKADHNHGNDVIRLPALGSRSSESKW